MRFIPLIKEPSNYSKYPAFASSRTFAPFFLNSNSVSFVEGGGGARIFLSPGRSVP